MRIAGGITRIDLSRERFEQTTIKWLMSHSVDAIKAKDSGISHTWKKELCLDGVISTSQQGGQCQSGFNLIVIAHFLTAECVFSPPTSGPQWLWAPFGHFFMTLAQDFNVKFNSVIARLKLKQRSRLLEQWSSCLAIWTCRGGRRECRNKSVRLFPSPCPVIESWKSIKHSRHERLFNLHLETSLCPAPRVSVTKKTEKISQTHFGEEAHKKNSINFIFRSSFRDKKNTSTHRLTSRNANKPPSDDAWGWEEKRKKPRECISHVEIQFRLLRVWSKER